MTSKTKKTIIFYFFLAAAFLFNSPSHAYVLQGPHLLELMIEKLGEAKSLSVSQTLIFYRVDSALDTPPSSTNEASEQPADSGGPAGQTGAAETGENAQTTEVLEYEEFLRYVFSHAFRSDVKSLDSERIYIFADGRTLAIVNGSIVAAASNRFDLYKDILLFRSRQALVQRLQDLGVDVSKSSLGRFEGQIAYIVGAEYPDESVSQVWVDQETFLPVRWIIKSVDGQPNSGSLEVLFLDWWHVGKTQYPSRIEFLQEGKLVRASQVKNVELNPTFPGELFDIERLKTMYPRASARAIHPGESAVPSEVQKTIDEFRRIFQ